MMNLKNAVKTFVVVGGILFAAGFSGCKCCADEQAKTCGKNDKAKADCCCPVLLVIQGQEENIPGDGKTPGCTVCTVWSAEYQPCMNAVAACPAQSCKALNHAPICEKCKEKIMKCATLRRKCGVCGKSEKPCAACADKLGKCKIRHLMTPESMKANQNCEACRKIAEAHARKHAEKSADGQAACGAPDAVLIVEEEVQVTGPALAPAPATAKQAQPAPAAATAKQAQPAPAAKQ